MVLEFLLLAQFIGIFGHFLYPTLGIDDILDLLMMLSLDGDDLVSVGQVRHDDNRDEDDLNQMLMSESCIL